MKVVLDSNVIIAAFAVRGLCHDLFEYCLVHTEVFTSPFILDEVSRVLKKKIKLESAKIQGIVDFLKQEVHIVEAKALEKKICRDKDDDLILSCALGAKADVIVTGDQDLLVLKQHKKIRILSPKEFYGLVNPKKN